ncbi:AAA domain-containing protein [Ditylenchus destructor]|nr:AAA domain-containing protein [Ditylenchus destructor]
MDRLMVELMDRVNELAEQGAEDVTGVPTGFTDLDKMTSGMQGGDLIIVAGRPSMGKTSFSMNIGEAVAINEGLPVIIYSMEMGAAQLALRMVGSIGRIDQSHLRTGRLQDDEWGRLAEAVDKLGNAPIYIDESPGLSPSEVRARARRQARISGQIGLIIIDYLQLMSGNGGASEENRATVVGEISRGLKALARSCAAR